MKWNKNSNNKILYIIGAVAGIVLVISIVLAIFSNGDSSVDETISFQLKGSETMSLYVGEKYREPGYLALGTVTGDLNKYVTVDGNVNTNSEGTYDIDYQLNYKGAVLYKTRTVNVLRKPVASQDVPSSTTPTNKNESTSGSGNATSGDDTLKIKLKGYTKIYMLNGVNYKEEGALVYSGGKEVSTPYTTTGSVDNNTPGTYKITYTVTENGKSASVDRTIEVLNMRMFSTVSEKNATNKSVLLKVRTETDKFKHIVLPDGRKVTTSSYEYVIEKNGSYTFEVVNEHGLKRKYIYNINNIDKSAPVGSCSGYTTGRKSFITMNAKDNLGVSKYVVDGASYTSNSITLDKAVSNPSITIYDLVGNTTTVTCTLENRYTYVSSDPGIGMKYQYINDGNSIPYALYSPSSASTNKGTPLIVWLHGSGEVGTGESAFKNSGLLNVLNNWKLDGVNAYVLCPHLTGRYSGSWGNQTAVNNVNALVDKIIKQYDIDTSTIIITGHSMGGIGTIYHAYYGMNRYAAMVPLSAYGTNVDLNQLKSMPKYAFVGTPAAGEDSSSYNYVTGTFKKTFGSDVVVVRSTSHGGIVKSAFATDSNKDNKSDLFEWMLAQKK